MYIEFQNQIIICQSKKKLNFIIIKFYFNYLKVKNLKCTIIAETQI